MGGKDGAPEAAFARLHEHFVSEPNVTEGTGFGKGPGLRVGGKIFAMLVGGELVVKLPASHIDELVEAGVGKRLRMGAKRVMREWISIAPAHEEQWLPLARDAYSFVAAGAPRSIKAGARRM